MSTWKCEVKKITDIQPIPNANNIVVAFLGGWSVVVGKDNWNIGDLVSYFPADSILPEGLINEMGLSGKLSGSAKNRVKPIKLRDQLSIGLVHKAPPGFAEGDDVSGHFGITLYEPPIPTELSGQCVARPREFKKYDVDNINDRLKDFVEGESVVMTCKLHGSNSACVMLNGEIKVMSRNYALAENTTNTYWMGFKNSGILDIIKTLPEGTWIMGEVVPTQKLRYGQNDPKVFVFDIKNPDGTYWETKRVITYCRENNIPFCPILYEGPFDLEIIRDAVTGMEPISGKKIHINEGGVVRPVVERNNYRGNRVFAKVVNPAYLLKDYDSEKVGG